MTLNAFLFAPENLAFACALVVFVGLGAVELAGTVLGFGTSSLFSGLDSDIDIDVDVDVDVEIDGTGAVHAAGGHGATDRASPDAETSAEVSADVGLGKLSALGFGRLPLTLVLLLGAMSLAAAGYCIQAAAFFATSRLWPWPLALAVSAVAALALWWVCARALSAALPDEGPTVAHIDEFIGAVAVIVNGPAKNNAPGQARFVDAHGHQQYVLVEPEAEDEQFDNGASVILVSRTQGARFFGVRAPFDESSRS